MLTRARQMAAILAAMLAVVFAMPAAAQEWPTRPIKIVVPFAAGGNVDVTTRIVGESLHALLGQPIVAENKTGAGSMIGSEAVAHSAPDGYTLLMTSASLINSPTLFNRTPYDWKKDFTFITAVSFQPLVVLVNPSNPAKDFASFLDAAKQAPGKLTMGTAGAGSFTHLAGMLLEQRTGVKFEAVHYRGTAPSLADLMANQISFQFEPIATALPMVNDKRLKPLAVTSLERAASLPNVPTIAESGVPGYEAINLLGLIGPADLPAPVVEKLSAAMKTVLNDPKVIAKFAELGTDARFTTPQAFYEIMHVQADTWIPVIRAANLKLE
jgi:tripartite-type tricarboxylate transporter receptor subunit TctC